MYFHPIPHLKKRILILFWKICEALQVVGDPSSTKSKTPLSLNRQREKNISDQYKRREFDEKETL